MFGGLLDLVVLMESGSFKLLHEMANIKTGNYAGEDKISYSNAKRVLIKSTER